MRVSHFCTLLVGTAGYFLIQVMKYAESATTLYTYMYDPVPGVAGVFVCQKCCYDNCNLFNVSNLMVHFKHNSKLQN